MIGPFMLYIKQYIESRISLPPKSVFHLPPSLSSHSLPSSSLFSLLPFLSLFPCMYIYIHHPLFLHFSLPNLMPSFLISQSFSSVWLFYATQEPCKGLNTDWNQVSTTKRDYILKSTLLYIPMEVILIVGGGLKFG